MNQCFQYFFIGFIIVVHLVTIKKFDICLFTGWSSTLFILLVNIFDHTFNLFINNIVRKPIIDESLFYVFYLFIKYCFNQYKSKCPLGDCISDNNNIYVGLNSTTLSRRLTMHLSDTSSIAQHLKKTFMPNNTTTENSHRQHNNIRTSK